MLGAEWAGEGAQTQIMEGPESPRGSRLPWECFSAWLDGVCVVTFDLELGQAMEVTSCIQDCGGAICACIVWAVIMNSGVIWD